MRWGTQTQFVATIERAGSTLGLIVSPLDGGRWGVSVFETPTPAPSLPPEQKMRQVLDQHAHELLEAQPTAAKAFALAEKYARWWRRSRASHTACDCTTVGSDLTGEAKPVRSTP